MEGDDRAGALGVLRADAAERDNVRNAGLFDAAAIALLTESAAARKSSAWICGGIST
jgi:hypothetical protein